MFSEKMFKTPSPTHADYRYWTDKILFLTKQMRKLDLCLYLGWDRASAQPVFPSLEDVLEIKGCCGVSGVKGMIYHHGVEYFLRSRVEPLQGMLNNLIHGAKAQVDGEDVPFSEIITWCQDAVENEKRTLLAKESRALCRFLAPYSHASWQALVAALDDLGYAGYNEYFAEKKGVSLVAARDEARVFLARTGDAYRDAAEKWLQEVTGQLLDDASRYDAIYLLGMRYLDHLFPRDFDEERAISFFRKWHIDLNANPAFHQHTAGKPGSQSYCIPVSIPDEIHIIKGPLQGWLDLEAVFHELGHAASFLATDKDIPPEERQLFPSAALSEVYAFLMQKICMSPPFLQNVMGLSPGEAKKIADVHRVKWLALQRRYAAKFVIEVDNFQNNRLQKGEEHYARVMAEATGFQYGPETYLFDLMPDFYSLDYFMAFVAVDRIWDDFEQQLGKEWMLSPEAGSILKSWWKKGNRAAEIVFTRGHR